MHCRYFLTKKSPRIPAGANRRSAAVIAVALLVAGTLASPVSGGMILRFDKDVYRTPAGEDLMLQIILDADGDEPGDQSPENGLFSCGIRVLFESKHAEASDESAISPQPELDFFGFGPGALTESGTGFAAQKGNIDLNSGGLSPYEGTTLGQIRLNTLAASGTSFTLHLEIWKAFPTEDVFIDGKGMILDPLIEAETADVVVQTSDGGSIDDINLMIRKEELPDGILQVILTYQLLPGRDHYIDFADSLAPNADWQPLPGSPHNSGKVSDPADGTARYYRLRIPDL